MWQEDDCAILLQVNVDPEALIPKLPRPRDLQPFPMTQALVRSTCRAFLFTAPSLEPFPTTPPS